MKKNIDQILQEICNREKLSDIYQIRIKNVHLWPLIRLSTVYNYIAAETGAKKESNQSQFNFKAIVLSTIKSYKHYIKYRRSGFHSSIVFIGFPRLEYFGGEYIDRFVDPIFEQFPQMKKGCLYLERGRSGKHKVPRYDISNKLWTEYFDNFSIIQGLFFAPMMYLVYRKTIKQLQREIFHCLPGHKISGLRLSMQLSINFSLIRLYNKLFKSLRVKLICGPILVHRTYLLYAAKLNGAKCFELQHGITYGTTSTYSTAYNSKWSLDLFLAFGKSSMIPIFGVPLDKMVNIGYAYKNYIINHTAKYKSGAKKRFLVLSEPSVTDKMIKSMFDLAENYPDYEFHFRCHPLEQLSESQLEQISRRDNTKYVSNDVSSFAAMLQYDGVLGENTTCLYEAITMGIKTAQLSINGLSPKVFYKESLKLFFQIDKIEQFKTFVSEKEPGLEVQDLFYSNFDKHAFLNLIQEYLYE